MPETKLVYKLDLFIPNLGLQLTIVKTFLQMNQL